MREENGGQPLAGGDGRLPNVGALGWALALRGLPLLVLVLSWG